MVAVFLLCFGDQSIVIFVFAPSTFIPDNTEFVVIEVVFYDAGEPVFKYFEWFITVLS